MQSYRDEGHNGLVVIRISGAPWYRIVDVPMCFSFPDYRRALLPHLNYHLQCRLRLGRFQRIDLRVIRER